MMLHTSVCGWVLLPSLRTHMYRQAHNSVGELALVKNQEDTQDATTKSLDSVVEVTPAPGGREDRTLTAIRNYEEWCRKQPGFECHPAIRHAWFPNGVRGLQWDYTPSSNTIPSTGRMEPVGPKSLPPNPNQRSVVLRIPQSMVLHTQYNTQDKTSCWDVNLACALWQELQKGDSSAYSGYCRWLLSGGTPSDSDDTTRKQHTFTTQQLPQCPTSTAPHTIRRWNADERDRLRSTASGRELLSLADQQTMKWKKHYEQLVGVQSKSQAYKNTEKNYKNNDPAMTWEQFEWAMEVVHSRAFRGIPGTMDDAPESLLYSVGSPILAAAMGVWYYQTHLLDFARGDDSTLLALGLGTMVALLPTLWQALKKPASSSWAVLLPFIDSANHDEQADSSIEYNPIRRAFELSVGPKCFVKAKTLNVPAQLFISYGKKNDKELLINFGFVPDAEIEDSLTTASGDEYRTRLADAYLKRNER